MQNHHSAKRYLLVQQTAGFNIWRRYENSCREVLSMAANVRIAIEEGTI
jgi:hypothetical protein